MILDELDEELAKTWAWDREQGEPEGDMWPRREMRDIL
jgi:hypothetical protein